MSHDEDAVRAVLLLRDQIYDLMTKLRDVEATAGNVAITTIATFRTEGPPHPLRNRALRRLRRVENQAIAARADLDNISGDLNLLMRNYYS